MVCCLWGRLRFWSYFWWMSEQFQSCPPEFGHACPRVSFVYVDFQQSPQTMNKAACKLLSEMDYSSTWLLVSGRLLQVITVQRSGFEAFLSCGYHVRSRWLCLISL